MASHQVIESAYTPHAIQELAHNATQFNRAFIAGIGAGKTLWGCHETLKLCAINSGCDGLIVTLTYPMFRDVVLPVWREWIPRQLWTYNKSSMSFALWNGRSIFVRSATEPDRIRGLSVGHAWLDEPAYLPNDDVYKIVQGRVRDPKAAHPGIINTSTLNGYNWFAKLFLAPTSTADYWHVICRTRDNPHISPEWEAQLRRDFGAELAAQELDGQVVELDHRPWRIVPAIHCKWDEVEAQRNKRHVFGGVDWGYRNHAAIVVCWKGNDGQIYVADAWKQRGRTTQQILDEVDRLTRKYGVRAWWADPVEPGSIQQGRQRGLPMHPCNKHPGPRGQERQEKVGIADVRELLHVKPNKQASIVFHPERLKSLLEETDEIRYSDKERETLEHGRQGQDLFDALRYAIHSETDRPRTKGYVL